MMMVALKQMITAYEVYDDPTLTAVLDEFNKCFTTPLTEAEQQLLILSGGLFIGDTTWMGKYSSLYFLSLFNTTLKASSDIDILLWYEYYNAISETSIGKKIAATFSLDKSLLKKYVRFIEYLKKYNFPTGIQSIQLTSDTMLEIEFFMGEPTFNLVIIDLSKTNVKVAFYLQTGTTTRTQVTFDSTNSIFTSTVQKK